MARHIELEPPSVNNLVQIMNSDLTTNENDRKHKFVNMVFKKLTKKIKDGVSNPKDQSNPKDSSSNRSATDENTSEDDYIDNSIIYLDSSEYISD